MEINEDDWIEIYTTIHEIVHSIINENLILCSNPKIEQFVCNDTFETFKNTCTSYLHEDADIYDDIYDLVEQIVDLELNNLDMPKRSLTMTLETIEDFNDETKDEIRNKLETLKNIPQPQQKSLDWYHFRYNLISASNLWKIFGTESQKNSLIYEKCKPLDLSRCEIQNYSSSGPMHWGVKYEPVTILIYEDMYKTKVEEFGCIQHPEYNFIGASPDGINIDETNNKFGKMLEIKNIVNREITGIPKTEYWIQTQIQMETCDLNECDFVETRFKEIEKEDEFYNLSTKHDYKGVILHFIEKPLFQNNDADFFQYKPCAPSYIYKPLEIENNQNEIEKWIDETKQSMALKNMAWFNTIYWYLEEFSCVVIQRNKRWFKDVVPIIKDFWDTIVHERKNGYEHRASKSRKQYQVSLNNESAVYHTNIKKKDTFCLIRLDESGNII